MLIDSMHTNEPKMKEYQFECDGYANDKMIDTVIDIIEVKLARKSWPTHWRQKCQAVFPGARSADAGGTVEASRSTKSTLSTTMA